MYKALKKAKIKADYEKRTFEIFEGFLLPDSYPILGNPEIIYLFELFIGEF